MDSIFSVEWRVLMGKVSPARFKNVTEQVDFQYPDDECLPITKCVCGKVFRPWEFIISIEADYPHSCPSCGAELIFSSKITVYQIMPEE